MLEETLLKIASSLDRASISYMLIGGYAMAAHGFPRMTQDVDISLGADIDRFDDVLVAVTHVGFKPITENPFEFARKTNVLLLEDTSTGIRVDLIFTFIDFERDAIYQAEEVIFKGVRIKIASIENLIVYKMLAGRARDIEDVSILLSGKLEHIDKNKISSNILGLATILENDSHEKWLSLLEATRIPSTPNSN